MNFAGLFAAWFVFGEDVKYNIYAIGGTYLILLGPGGRRLSLIVSFVFNFGFLLVSYYLTASQDYDILWTTPHCMITLRLIGLSFDLYDGDRGRRLGRLSLSKEQEETALEETPSLLEILSHNFFLGGYFVGPFVPMKKYQEFACPTYQTSLPSSPLGYGFQRLCLGLLYLLIHLGGSVWLPSDWPASQEFSASLLVTKVVVLPAWLKTMLAKYLAAWLLAEGVCVISGLAFTGLTQEGEPDWSGCVNIKIRRLETATRFHHVIESFHLCTNHWVAVYIYKRLKFLGSKNVSQVVSLIFLAVWHGFHSGYYLTFIHEFLFLKLEREFLAIWDRSQKVERWLESPGLVRLFHILAWLAVQLLLPHGFIAFSLLTFDKFYPAYAATYFLLYLVLASWPLVKGLLKWFLLDENNSDQNPTVSAVENVDKKND